MGGNDYFTKASFSWFFRPLPLKASRQAATSTQSPPRMQTLENGEQLVVKEGCFSSSVGLISILWTRISGNGAQKSMVKNKNKNKKKQLPRYEDGQPGLETTGSAGLKHWVTSTKGRSYHGRQAGDAYLPCLVLLINAKQLDAEGSRGAPVDGAEAAGLLGQRDGC